MAEYSNKIKLLKLYELLQKDTDEDQLLSKTELCKRLTEQGVPVSIRTIDRDIPEASDSLLRRKTSSFSVSLNIGFPETLME